MKQQKSKLKVMQRLRILVQIVSFVLIPGLYVTAFSGIQAIYQGFLTGNSTVVELWPQIVATVAVIPITVLFGRFFCGWMCAFGTLGDFIYKISQTVLHRTYRIGEKQDAVLKKMKYVMLGFLIIAVWTFNWIDISSWNPWDAFGMIGTVGATPDFLYVAQYLMPGAIIFGAIVIGSAFVERFFCRYLCPLGAVFALTSKMRVFKIIKPRTACGACSVCTNHCPMGIKMNERDAIHSGECINCFQCISHCPRQNVSVAIREQDVKPALAGVMAVTVMAGAYYAGNLSLDAGVASYSAATSVSTSIVATTTGANTAIYEDGTYQGVGTGFRGGQTTVSVTIKDDVITDVSVVSYQDDEPFFNRAASTVISEILQNQDTSVNAVSGATYSSNGIMSAVADALSSAMKA